MSSPIVPRVLTTSSQTISPTGWVGSNCKGPEEPWKGRSLMYDQVVGI